MTKISKNFTHFSERQFVDSKCGGGCESCESNANPTDSSANLKDSHESYAQFTADMKATHTILVPTMLPIHFRFMVNLLHSYGYKAELLENANKAVVDEGLRAMCIMILVILRCL